MNDDTQNTAGSRRASVEDSLEMHCRTLRDRGLSVEQAQELMAQLAPFIAHAREVGLDAACGDIPAFQRLLRKQKVDRDDARRFVAAAQGFADWQRGVVPELTEERIAELERLSQVEGAPIPSDRNADVVIGAMHWDTTADVSEAIACHLAAFHGIAAKDACALKVTDVDWPTGSLQVREDPKYVISLDEWLSKALARLTAERGPEDSLLVNERGEALTPRRLQQRVAGRVESLESRLSEPVTLERLRDHAAYWMLDNGGTLEDVARAFGYGRVATARRRFGSEPWAYLADREGNWFSAGAAALAEGVEVEDIARWVAGGLRHERHGDRVFVRKEDVRQRRRRPAGRSRPVLHFAADQEADPPTNELATDLAADFGALFGADGPDGVQQAVERLSGRTQPVAPPPGDELFAELTRLAGPILAKIGRLRERPSKRDHAGARIVSALGLKSRVPNPPVPPDYATLHAWFVNSSGGVRELHATVVALDASPPDAGLRNIALGQFHSGLAVQTLSRLLSKPEQAADLWLLVDRYYDELIAHLNAAGTHYGIPEARMNKVGVGCVLYAFFVALLAASPELELPPKGSVRRHEDLLFEALTQWLLLTLSAAKAIPLGQDGALLHAPVIANLEDQVVFIAEFLSRWERTERFRRSAWAFRVVPGVSVFDIIRYVGAGGARGMGFQDPHAQAAVNHLLYLSKRPTERLLLPHGGLPSETLQWLLYVLYLPLLNSQYKEVLDRLGESTDRKPDDLESLAPPDWPERVRSLCYRSWEAFDFRRGAAEEAPEGRVPGTAYTRYLLARARREFSALAKELLARVLEVTANDPGTLAQSQQHSIASLPHSSSPVDGAPLYPTVDLPDGTQFLTTWWAGRGTGMSQRWVQMHTEELNGQRAGEVIQDADELERKGLSPDQWLIPMNGLELAVTRTHTPPPSNTNQG